MGSLRRHPVLAGLLLLAPALRWTETIAVARGAATPSINKGSVLGGSATGGRLLMFPFFARHGGEEGGGLDISYRWWWDLRQGSFEAAPGSESMAVPP
jgi:hypothetical protein